jgi:hypothetical protein
MSEIRPQYSDSVQNIIRKRFSVRTYSGESLAAEIREKILLYAGGLKGPFNVRTRFKLMDIAETKEITGLRLGTYGMISGARTFIAAAVEKKEHAMEELGYVFEDMVLYITSLGLGTCWLAGTFNRSVFSKAFDIGQDEYLPIVSPVGAAGNNRSLVDFLLKPDRNAKARKLWHELFFRDSFKNPLGEAEAGAYSLPLEMVRLAPSASNRQPWRILADNGNFHFYLSHTPLYDRRYPYDIQKIDIGIAMFHFESTAREAGLKGKWDMLKPSLSDLPSYYEYIATWVSLQSAA